MPEPVATYKDLCLDATTDPPATAAFWAAALGTGPVVDRDGPWLVRAPTPRQVLWVNPVAEPRTVKNRLHVDVHCASVDELVARGARVLETCDHWTVLADPDGGEFCAFVREEPPAYRLYELVLDCADPIAMARWWAGAIGGTVDEDGDGIADIPEAPFEFFCFQAVPEPKRGKNRVHIDVEVDAVESLVAHGASVLRHRGGDIDWTVMADPEGNEFCAFLR